MSRTRDETPSPSEQGLAMPPDWAPHGRTWMCWPCRADTWGSDEAMLNAKQATARIARAISTFEPVVLAARHEDVPAAKLATAGKVALFETPLDDSWARDIGPTFLRGPAGGRGAVQWRFNAWGGKYRPYNEDAALAARIATAADVRLYTAPLVCEGGAIHTDGEGTLLATEQCLLNSNRNPQLTQQQVEEQLALYTGARRIVWLGMGFSDSETDGHVDNIACFVAPGRVEAQAPPPKLTAPPVLKIPNKELRLADLNVAFSAAALQPPALPVPPSATSPVRTEEGTEGLAAALDALAGQAAVNVISISPALPAQQLLTIPGGLVNAPRANAVGSADRAAPGNAPGSKPAVGNGNGNGTGTGTGTANGSGRDVAAAMPPIRIEHPPNGKFDVVLMQSAARDDLPELGGILAGNPVYTVYLSVGDRKEWLLEFCVPSAPKPASNPYQVFVDSPAVLAPPYPLLTVIPGAVAKASRSKYVVIHGFLTATGAFRDAGAPDAKDALAQALLPSLSTWRFRPATRDRQPVEVEILLVVPPES